MFIEIEMYIGFSPFRILVAYTGSVMRIATKTFTRVVCVRGTVERL